MEKVTCCPKWDWDCHCYGLRKPTAFLAIIFAMKFWGQFWERHYVVVTESQLMIGIV